MGKLRFHARFQVRLRFSQAFQNLHLSRINYDVTNKRGRAFVILETRKGEIKGCIHFTVNEKQNRKEAT